MAHAGHLCHAEVDEPEACGHFIGVMPADYAPFITQLDTHMRALSRCCNEAIDSQVDANADGGLMGL